jgi:hypothetical protein
MLVSVQQSQLVDQDGSEREPSGGDQPLGGHLCVTVEDALELPVEVL